jgi:hypothetical protein
MAAKLSKIAVNYRGSEGKRERCGNCSMFRYRTSDAGEAIDLCTLVEGHIRPQDLCDRWSPITKRQ